MDLIVDNGKPVEPSTTKKIISSLKGDIKMTMVFSHTDIQQLIVDQIYNSTSWLKSYKKASLKHNVQDDTYTVEWNK